jgi:hypothetical protein
MPRGYPDYQNPVNQVAGRLVDFAGIQTAILGLAPLDGLGRLVWHDRFQEGLSAWYAYQEGTGVAPAIAAGISEIPPSSCKLDVSAGGGLCNSIIIRSILFSDPVTFGVEFSVLYNQGPSLVTMSITRVKGGIGEGLAVSYVCNTGVIRVEGLGAPVTYKTLLPTIDARLWIPIKLVVNFDEAVGRRLVILMDTFPLDTIKLSSVADATAERITFKIKATATGLGSLAQYIGHVYLTADEP